MTPSSLISINTLCLEPAPFETHVETIKRIGASAIGPERAEIEACGAAQAARLLRDAGLPVALLTHRSFGFATAEIAAAERARLDQTIDLAHAIDAPAICLTTGGRGHLGWKEAVARFVDAIATCADYARTAGVRLGIEPTSHLYVDFSLAHRLSDLVTLARSANISLGIDTFSVWSDSDLEEAIAAAGPLCAFVQVSDYVLGDRALPCRAVPGDGVVPLDRIIRLILETGYRGPFDIEVIGPRLAAEGYEHGLRRAIARVAEAIQRGKAGEPPRQGAAPDPGPQSRP